MKKTKEQQAFELREKGLELWQIAEILSSSKKSVSTMIHNVRSFKRSQENARESSNSALVASKPDVVGLASIPVVGTHEARRPILRLRP